MIASILMLYYNYIEVGKIDSAFYYLDQIPLIDDNDEGMINYFEEGILVCQWDFSRRLISKVQIGHESTFGILCTNELPASKVENFKIEEK
jgi:hypothetical protein